MIRTGYVRDEELACEVLVIMDEASGDTIEVQRALPVDPDDEGSVDDDAETFCLVRNGAAFYGGLDSWSLQGGTLTMALTDEAAAVLEFPTVVEIPLPASEVDVVLRHLPRILAPRDE